MHVEQFRISNNGKGYRIQKSPDVDNWLSQLSYQRVAYQKVKRGMAYMETETWLDKDQVYARSALRSGIDNLGREIIINHTLLIRYRDLAEAAVKQFNFPQFLSQPFDPSAKVLPPLEM